jgi:hypothetical protein
VQGPHQKTLYIFLVQLSKLFPSAEIIWSSYKNDSDRHVPKNVKVVFSEDPGPLNRSKFGGKTNCSSRRQIISFAAGLKIASRPIILKLRSDIWLFDRTIFLNYLNYQKSNSNVILVNNESTHRPTFLFPSFCHFGDWLFIGKRELFSEILKIDVENIKDEEINNFGYFMKFIRLATGMNMQTTSCEMEIWKPVIAKLNPTFQVPKILFEKSPEIFKTHNLLRDNYFKLIDKETGRYTLLKGEYAIPAYRFQHSYSSFFYNKEKPPFFINELVLSFLKFAYAHYCYTRRIFKFLKSL